jgi:peroxiredoxin
MPAGEGEPQPRTARARGGEPQEGAVRPGGEARTDLGRVSGEPRTDTVRPRGGGPRTGPGRLNGGEPVREGEPAPDFALSDQHGRSVRLGDFRGRRHVVVMFFPFAFTGVCTGELRAVQEALPGLQNDEVQLLAVSCDSMHALRVFSDTEGLEFPLLSDFWPHGAASRAYGVFAEDKGCALRGTFVVDKAGVVRWTVVNALPEPRDLRAYTKALQAL